MKRKKFFGRKLLSIIMSVLLLSGTFLCLDFGEIIAQAGSISYWDGTSETPNTDDLNSAYPDDLYKTTNDASTGVLHIKSARGMMLYANVVKNKGWFREWNVVLDTDIDLQNHNWVGVGDNGSNVFTGTFDGQGHTVYNMKIDATNNDWGFFRKAEGATIKNINFDLCTVSTPDMSGSTHAVVVGWCNANACTFENITVTRSKVYGDAYIGGIVGSADSPVSFTDCRNLYSSNYSDRVCNEKDYFVKGNDGFSSDGGVGGIVGRVAKSCSLTLTNCVNSAYVSITGGSQQNFRIGGLVGKAHSTADISGCKNYGTVGDENDRKGLTAGIIGNADWNLTVTDTYNYGNVYGLDTTAGFLGWFGESNVPISFTNCANYGNISGTTDKAAGFLAYSASDDTATFVNCTNSGNVTASGNAGGIVGYTCSSVDIRNCTNNGIIISTSSPHVAGICAHIDDDFMNFEDCTNNGSIYAGTTDRWDNACAGILGDYNGACSSGWTFYFRNCENNGELHGGAAIGGIIGYFGDKASAVKYNNKPTVRLYDCRNTGRVFANNSDSNCAGLIGHMSSDNDIYFTDCSNTGNVTATSNHVGGLGGNLQGYVHMDNCSNSGNISGNSKVGGLVGRIEDDASTFSACTNTGNITSLSQHGAGLVGSFNGNNNMKFMSCVNKGDVTGGGNSIGGFVGHTSGSITIERGMNTGNISITDDSASYVAGLVAWIDDDTTTISDSVNFGDISGGKKVGGLVGGIYGSTITFTNCGNLGNLTTNTDTSDTYAGGIIADFSGTSATFSQCYNGNGTRGNIGSPTHKFSRTGGLAGWLSSGYLIDCYSNATLYGNMDSTSYVGGLIGEVGDSKASIDNAYVAGHISGYDDDGNGRAATLSGRNDPPSDLNTYYLANCFTGNFKLQGSEIAEDYLRSTDMINYNLSNGSWMLDQGNINNGYPILYQSIIFTQDITFSNYDGTVLDKRAWLYSTMPIYIGSTPTRESDDANEYIFVGWDREIVEVSENAVYTAVYTAVSHNYSYVSIDNAHHHYICDNCGYIKSGSVNNHELEWISDGNSGHHQTCTVCGYATEADGHTLVYVSGEQQHWHQCTICGYTTEKTNHKLVDRYDSAQHWKYCETCRYSTEKTDHIMDNVYNDAQHWQSCNTCGYKSRINDHSFVYESDADGHIKYCTGCDYRTEKTEHQLEYGTNARLHWLNCSECGYSGTRSSHNIVTRFDNGAHWEYCDICEYEGAHINHNVNIGKDDDGHWEYCPDCDYITVKTGHTTTFNHNDYEHWLECPACGMIMSDIEAHTYADGGICDKCGFEDPGYIMEINIDIDSREWTSFEANSSIHAAADQLPSVVHIDTAQLGQYAIASDSLNLYITLTNNYNYKAKLLSDRPFNDESIAGNYIRFDLAPKSGYTFADIARLTAKIRLIGANGEPIPVNISINKVSPSSNQLRITIKNDETGMALIPHTHSQALKIDGLEPTEFTEGWKDHYQCGFCNAIFEDEELTTSIINLDAWKTGRGKLPMTGHVYIEETVTEATCTQDGVKKYTCKFCNDSYTETITASGHDFGEWSITVMPTTQDGMCERECSRCHETETRVLVSKLTECVVKNGFVYGLSVNTSVSEFLNSNVINNEAEISISASAGAVMGTGTQITVTYPTGEVIVYTVVIFGDVNGDGWYDGMDSVIVNLIANGLITENDIPQAEYLAADCNHDGNIDVSDVDILSLAGVLLSSIDQSQTNDELLETSAVFAEYIELIDQDPSDGEADEAEPTPVPVNKTGIFEVIINIIARILRFIKTYIIAKLCR